MKKYLCLIAATTVSFALMAQEPQQQQQQQQQQQINVYPPDQTPPPTTPPPATTTTPVATVKDNDNDNDGGFMLGFRYMPTISSFDVHTSQGVASADFVLSHGFGGFIGVKTSNHFNLQLEIIYLQLAQKFQQNDVTNTVKLSYVNVPLMAVFNTGLDQPVNFNACIGPQIGFNTGSSLDVENGNDADTIHAVLAVKKADIGLAYGVGLDIGGENVKFAVGFRGVYGLVDISDQSHNITTDQYYILDRSHVKTYSGYIGVTFLF
jgi:hypothetical protein